MKNFFDSFQFTPLREGRRNSRKSRLMGRYFNSRPSARGDGVVKDGRIHQRDFNSRPSARGDGLPGVYPPGMTRISIHAPPRGATGGYAVGATLMTISIHAPPRGATGSIYKNRIAVGYFNSRPSARGDLNPPPPRAAVPVFQFTPLREGRRKPEPPHCGGSPISIHAPPRGATPTCSRKPCPRPHFNSRPSARGDAYHARPPSKYMRYFNSRSSARGDRLSNQAGRETTYFNSRPSARGDCRSFHSFRSKTYFNSRPSARGD